MTQIHKKEYELIDEVIENFDFYRCHRVMKHLKWTWTFDGGVPTIDRLRESARKRIEGAIEGIKESKKHSHLEGYFSFSGGLKATVWKNRYGQITNIQLDFILTEWNAGED
jgi:hypothetical protein